MTAISESATGLEWQLEARRQRQAGAHLLHLGGGRLVGLGAGIVERRRNQVFQHALLARLHQAVVDAHRDDPALCRGLDFDKAPAARALHLDIVEIVLGLLQLGLRVLRHLHDLIEVEVGHDQSLVAWAGPNESRLASGKLSKTARTLGSSSTAERVVSSAICS